MNINPLKNLLLEDIPVLKSKTDSFTVSLSDIKHVWQLINTYIFADKLSKPKFIVKNSSKYWGLCIGNKIYNKKSGCVIYIAKKVYSIHHLVYIVAHEMIHQYQWDIDGKKRLKKGLKPIMSHGPSFFKWKNKMNKYWISIKRRGNMDFSLIKRQHKKYLK